MNPENADEDLIRQNAPNDDDIRDAVTWKDSTTYSLSLPHVYARFVEAGINRSLRTLQRYCEQGHLRAAKYPTEMGAVWYVDPGSVETKIEEIRQVQETLHRSPPPAGDASPSTAHDMSRQDADCLPVSSVENKGDNSNTTATTRDDEPRQQGPDVASRASNSDTFEFDGRVRQASPDSDSKYLSVPVVMLDALTAQLDAKNEQIKRQNMQMEMLMHAHDQDRQLLGAALALVHGEDFPRGVNPESSMELEPDTKHAEEIRPEFGKGGGKSHHPSSGFGV